MLWIVTKPPHNKNILTFGGKSEPFDLEFCVAKLAMITGRPVKILYTREEVFYAHRGRHQMRMKIEVGGKKDGHITSVRLRSAIDGGAFSTYGVVTTYYSGQLLTAPVRMDAYEFDATRFFSTKPACGAKRGHGSVQPRFAGRRQEGSRAAQHRRAIDAR